jgi:tripartite ATP-independent transporter DctM subunit
MAIALITLIILIAFIIFGVELGIALMFCSILGIFLSTGNFDIAVNILSSTAYSALREYIFGVTPLFVMMGLLANLSGGSEDLYNAVNILLKKVKGGLGIATVIANAIFAAITGVSIASAAVFTKVAVPQMRRLGYHKRFAVGTVAGSSILGMLIPPSVLMIIYGMLADTSIGKLFVAGVVPGIIMTIAFIITIKIIIKIKPEWIEGNEGEIESQDHVLKTVMKPWPLLVLILITLGGIWAGFFTPTEAGGVGAFGALIIVIMKGKFSIKSIWDVLLNTGVTTGSILFLLVAAQMYSRALAVSGDTSMLGEFITSLQVPSILIIIVFLIVLVLLGTILDSTSILLLTMPLFVPIVNSFGMNLVWFGIIAIIAIEVGIITPPFGIAVFTVKSSLGELGSSEGDDITIEDIFAGAIPFIIAMFVVLAILIAFPYLSTCLI